MNIKPLKLSITLHSWLWRPNRISRRYQIYEITH